MCVQTRAEPRLCPHREEGGPGFGGTAKPTVGKWECTAGDSESCLAEADITQALGSCTSWQSWPSLLVILSFSVQASSSADSQLRAQEECANQKGYKTELLRPLAAKEGRDFARQSHLFSSLWCYRGGGNLLVSPVSQQGLGSSFPEGGSGPRPRSKPLAVDIPASRWQQASGETLESISPDHSLATPLGMGSRASPLEGPSLCLRLGRGRVDVTHRWALPVGDQRGQRERLLGYKTA